MVEIKAFGVIASYSLHCIGAQGPEAACGNFMEKEAGGDGDYKSRNILDSSSGSASSSASFHQIADTRREGLGCWDDYPGGQDYQSLSTHTEAGMIRQLDHPSGSAHLERVEAAGMMTKKVWTIHQGVLTPRSSICEK